ncbi:hypothetical protein PR202_ga21415 [Eleusine coracana subsp. coracana]|uniref:HECT-type E3 ubiquitin transferase n=1 Tax=Eleusine coracana subsp. coracana TaxID=191504 RepID=A0AAV5D0S6_ELECO|nr:hypothetical protein PR202_ga21415 [Eleusine coracana subsp. coracana]
MLMTLLRSVDECMAMIGTGNRMPSSSLPPFVRIVLAEVDAWSDTNEWPEIRVALRAAHSRRRGLLDFESRSRLAMATLPELDAAAGNEEPLEMLIDRSCLLSDSFEYVADATPEGLRDDLWVEFRDEEATGHGVRREWFCMVFQALFSPSQVLFSACPSDRRRFFVNPTSVMDPLHLKYYEFAGRMIALALMYKIQVGVLFDRTLFLQLADRPVTLDDIADADPSLHASCKKILEMDSTIIDSNDLGLTFVREVELLGSRTVVELISRGRDIAVNSRESDDCGTTKASTLLLDLRGASTI